MRHKTADEGDIAGKAIEFRDHHRASRLTGASEGSGQLRPAVERIRTLSGLDLDMLGDDLDPLVFSKPRYSGLLSLNAQPAAALLLS